MATQALEGEKSDAGADADGEADDAEVRGLKHGRGSSRSGWRGA